ncbi:MAG: VCBS repeat-containing protein [Nitrospirae bacterium]|uniref:FG-GAP repeat domain-containing protein n=1 Tax=Candidatus Magnetobacterium casense TaxID=1455061 RepID=UPI00058F859D|nr:VCBS repeat-containing protein [Candidatus Magnetobacterium casensis]MBF0338007.1 VCBS repeat-containing protein [Nitrospirota bacterium]
MSNSPYTRLSKMAGSIVLILALLTVFAGCKEEAVEKKVNSRFIPAGGTPYSVIAADLNGDGLKDAVFFTKYKGLDIYFAQGNALNLNEPTHIDSLLGTSISSGDFNGDKVTDLAYIYEDKIHFLINGGFGKDYDTSHELAAPKYGFDLKTPDLNNDSISDIAAVGIFDQQLYLYLSRGPLDYELAKIDFKDSRLTEVFAAKYLSVDDVNEDGFVDILVPEFKNNALWLIKNIDGKTFQPVLLKYFAYGDPAEFNNKIQYASLLFYDKDKDISYIAYVRGVNKPEIAILAFNNKDQETTLVKTAPLSFPFPVAIEKLPTLSPSTRELLVTHLFKDTGSPGALSLVSVNTGDFTITTTYTFNLPCQGKSSVYMDTINSALTACTKPDGLNILSLDKP